MLALRAGTDVFRVHDVAELRQALDAAAVLLGAEAGERTTAPDGPPAGVTELGCRLPRGSARRPGIDRPCSSFGGSRSTRTTASRTPSRSSASGCVIDVSFDVPDCDAVLTDRLEDTIDYADVADIVVLAATNAATALSSGSRA